MKQILFSVLICFFAIACGNSDKTDTTTQTNDTLSTLITPVVPPPVDAGTSTSTASAIDNPNVVETLQQAWVLDSINGKAIVPADFQFGTPYMDISLDNKTLKGHAGCNGINGKISVNGKKVKVEDLVTTKIACKNSSFENGFLKTLRSSSLTYEIKVGSLYLKSSGSQTYIFRKIRMG